MSTLTPQTPNTPYGDGAVRMESNALSLWWSFGFNTTLPGSVINLSDGQRQALFYVSANTGLIHDLMTGQQNLLQGHVRDAVVVV
jgi:hypothetical protein